MLQFSDIYFKYDDQPLFSGLSLTIHAGHKACIVGRNGVGKSTLFELLLGNLIPDDGDIRYPKDWRVATLRQNIAPSERSALDFVMDGDAILRNLERTIERATKSADDSKLVASLSAYEDQGGYRYTQRAETILQGLGFTSKDFDKPHRDFSGGWRIRLNLAQTLMVPSDYLLLDEPTNHLDLEAVSWLYRWLFKYEGTVVLIAHDREFIDRIATEVIHLDQGVARTYSGGYSAFEKQRAALLLEQETLLQRQEKERARIQKFVDRFRAKASKAKQVQSRIKLLEKMTYTAVLRDEAPYKFTFSSPARFDQPMVSFQASSIGYGDETVIRDFTQRIYPKDRIGILGINGAGKTTLLKAIAKEIDPLHGVVELSTHTTVGYFAQHQLEVLEATSSAYKHIEESTELSAQSIRNFLGAWGFSGSTIFRPVSQLSGGEKARLVLAKLALRRPAILVLDEPTNHLDLEMRNALASALDNFEGAVVLVAHDQHLLRQCVNDFWLIRDGTISVYRGDLDDYEAMLNHTGDVQVSKSSFNSRAKRRQRALLRERKRVFARELSRIESSIEEISGEVQSLTDRLQDPSTLKHLDRNELNSLLARHSNLTQESARLEAQWYSLTESMDRFSGDRSQ
ncbi:MAG: ABC-F family ATP-binding cassette domain-containing protein [Gammaproteobacteria bacterium]|nr:ABC-F family ATP-binding cassette domain-containing protein [Gammaproteobacteria bacterium]